MSRGGFEPPTQGTEAIRGKKKKHWACSSFFLFSPFVLLLGLLVIVQLSLLCPLPKGHWATQCHLGKGKGSGAYGATPLGTRK